MLCRLSCVFHFRFENLYNKIFTTTPHIIWQHSPRLGAIFIFLILKCFKARTIKEFWAFFTFDLISFTWMWGDDVMQIMVCVPFLIWKSVHQNICYHSPRLGAIFMFFNSKMLRNKEDKRILSILELWFKLIYMTVRWWCCADYRVCSIFDLKICTTKYLLPLPT